VTTIGTMQRTVLKIHDGNGVAEGSGDIDGDKEKAIVDRSASATVAIALKTLDETLPVLEETRAEAKESRWGLMTASKNGTVSDALTMAAEIAGARSPDVNVS
jgi:hypothetical protein